MRSRVAHSDQIEGGEEGEFPPHWLMSSPLLVHKMAFQGGKVIFPPTAWSVDSLIRDSVLALLGC